MSEPLPESPITKQRPCLYQVHNVDALEWLRGRPARSIHAVVTDPPYGLLEYRTEQLSKMRRGSGGVWRLPPSFDGCKRSPLPRFTILTDRNKRELEQFFNGLAVELRRVLVPGGHVFIASNPLVSHHVYLPFILNGFEKRGEIIRVVKTLRGGDRPKNAHREFDMVSVMPRACWEPWGLFRKPLEGRVKDNLRQWKTGGLRRISKKRPFGDLILSSPAAREERRLAPHPSLKPQAFMRQVVGASLPLKEGTILDPFMGSGATIAAATHLGFESIGLERDPVYFEMARQAIPLLTRL